MDLFSSANPTPLPGHGDLNPVTLLNNLVNNTNHTGSSGSRSGGTINFPTTSPLVPTTTSTFYVGSSTNESGLAYDVFTTPAYALLWVTLTNVLVLVTGVVGNALVIVVVLCVREMRTPTNLCLVNLSLADLLVLVICQPSAMLEFYEEEKWMLGSFMCKLTVFLENMVCLASILIILSVSFERYYAVCYPLKKHSTESRSKALRLMLGMWLTAALVTSPMLAIAQTRNVLHFVERVNVTVCTSNVSAGWPRAYVVTQFVVVFAVPLCLLVFFYSRIIFKVAVDTMGSRQMTDTVRAQVQRSRQQLVVMLVGVVALFFVCLLPFRIAALCWIYGSCMIEPEARLNLLHLFRLLVYINSAGNPIIYSLVSTKFRRAFSRVLQRLGCRCRCLVPGGGQSNGAVRRTTVTHYTSVRPENDQEDEMPSDAL